MIDQDRIQTLFDWMCAGAQPPADMSANVEKLMSGLVAAGVPVSRFAIFILTIHPTTGGKRIAWRAGAGVEVDNATHEFFDSPYYKASPIRVVYETIEPMRRCFARGDAADFEDLEDLRRQGVTDYYAQPLIHVGGENHGMTWATEAPEGFSEEMIAALDKLNPAIARLLEIYTLKINTIALLSTYVGRDAGAAVLDGRIVRGDVERIPCAILFADLKDFTSLSNAEAPERVLATLNAYFGSMETSVYAHGGEILKFIGDGLLAIFPFRDGEAEAARNALTAVDEARMALAGAADFRAALHAGLVHYGNIGGATRLDFTAIGPDVNLTARLLGEAGTIEAETVCSEAFAAVIGERAAKAGHVVLKGFADPAPIYRL